jgi:hypothetical protein
MPRKTAAAELLADLSHVLEGHRWYLFGAQAVNIFGRPRMTADVDVTVEWRREELPALLKKARDNGFELLVSEPARFLKQASVLPFSHRATGMPLDLVLSGSGLESDILDNARPVRIGRRSFPVIAPEDLVITKILAGRPKDIEDAQSVLYEQRDSLDLKRVRGVLRDIEKAVDVSDLVRTLDSIAAKPKPSKRAKASKK